MQLIIVFLLGNYFLSLTGANESPKVKIAQGVLSGTSIITRGGKKISAFLGIPYAAAPTGKLRFKSPQPAPKWEGIRDASKEGNECLQQFALIERFSNITGSEDCLYLNVFTPKSSRDKKFPVMFFIHGGGYVGGSGSVANYGPELLLDRGVVLVAINYRLGPLGFLSTGDSVLPGNLGLKDQLAALRWVQKNIEQFGGDKNSVTIFGESAGGASVNFLILSPQSKGLFHRGISQSGSALCPWAYKSPEQHKQLAEKLGDLVGCPFVSSQDFLECLMLLPADMIVGVVKTFIEWDIDPVVSFNPAIEPNTVQDAVLTEHPWTLTSNVPWMVGFNENEGNLKIASLTQGDVDNKMKQLNDNFKTILPMALLYQHTAKNPDTITEAIKNYYFGGSENITLDMIPQLSKLYADGLFGAGILEAARHHNGPVFLYYFTYKSSFSLCSEYFNNPNPMGICHFDDLLYLFPMEGHAPKEVTGDPDYLMSLKMTQLWTNFAQNKTPRLDNQEFWHTSKGSPRDYLHISNEGLSLQQDLIYDSDRFWQSLPYREKPLLPHLKNLISDEL